MLLQRLRCALKPLLSGGMILAATLGIAWACADTVAPRTTVPPAAELRMSLADAYRSGRPAVFRSGVAADRCLDAAYARHDEGTPVVISSCHGQENQLFSWGADGLLRVYSTGPMCVTVQGAGAHLDPIVLAPCDGRSGQRWALTAGGWGIQLAGTDVCLDVPYADPTPATQLIVGTCHGRYNQQWDVPSVTSVHTSLTDAYGSGQRAPFISGVAPDRCMDILDARRDDGAPVIIYNCHGGDNQQIAWAADGTLRVFSSDVRCVTDQGGAMANLDNIVAAPCDGRSGQRWQPTSDGTGIQLIGSGRCIDVPYADATPRTQLVLWDCHGRYNQQWDVRGISCGVSYTSVTSLQDAELADYGVATQTDTTRVCETWTGSDYTGRVVQVGSSEPVSEYSDQTQTVTYAGGQAAGFDATGAPTHAPEAVGPDAFDVVQATDAERQASYDDPYYALSSDGGGGCANPTEIICTSGPAYSRAPSGSATSSGAGSADTTRDKFTKHGLKRRGVRALVEDKEEIGRGANGNRRFRAVKDDEETVVELDVSTELMMVQETTSPRGHTKATFTWAKRKDKRTQRDMYVRDRLDVESEEIVDGKVRRGHATVVLSDLQWGAP